MIGAEAGPIGDIAGGLGSTMMQFATMGIVMGVLLYYIIPMMPFIYFFFAVGRWVKSVFEAMIAIPLWALAHMRLGGDGIPGSAASQGYFLILEILLRPVFTVFGLLMAVATFAAMDVALDSVFNLAVMNVGGYDMTTLSSGAVDDFMASARDGIDALFYTILYVIIVYMMATSSFKLIEIIPSALMRWIGSNSSAFNDSTDVDAGIDNYLTQRSRMIAEALQGTTNTVANAINTKNILGGGK
jgi:conjugal transfer/type IV secretion protein DotA/TraY